MERPTTRLRALLKDGAFLYMPAVYYPLAGRLVESLGFEAVYCGGYVTGGSLAVSEPLLTMDEQLRLAGAIANAVSIPLVVDGGAGFGEPLHTMRTVREAVRAGIAGMHIEDQLYPKRAHYHKYVAHAIPAEDFVAKIAFACRARDEADPDFVVIARTDTCRFHGLDEAADRLNRAADVGADMGLLFPRDDADAKAAPKRCRLPLVYVQSRGNRDGRPLYSNAQLRDMGYRACIDAQIVMLAGFHAARRALEEVRDTGEYTALSNDDCTRLRQEIEDLIGLDRFYAIEEETVEKTRWGKR
jgi:methylisocitrate lyase